MLTCCTGHEPHVRFCLYFESMKARVAGALFINLDLIWQVLSKRPSSCVVVYRHTRAMVYFCFMSTVPKGQTLFTKPHFVVGRRDVRLTHYPLNIFPRMSTPPPIQKHRLQTKAISPCYGKRTMKVHLLRFTCTKKVWNLFRLKSGCSLR